MLSLVKEMDLGCSDWRGVARLDSESLAITYLQLYSGKHRTPCGRQNTSLRSHWEHVHGNRLSCEAQVGVPNISLYGCEALFAKASVWDVRNPYHWPTAEKEGGGVIRGLKVGGTI